MNEPQWPSAAVALGLLALIGGIAIAAVVSYDVDDALKVWSALGTLLGLITGVVAAYFFTRGTVQQAQNTADTARESAEGSRDALARVQEQLEALRQHAERATLAAQENQTVISRIMALLPKSQTDKLIADEAIASALSPQSEPTPPATAADG